MSGLEKKLDYALHGGGLAIAILLACAGYWFACRPVRDDRDEALARSVKIAELLGEADHLRAQHAEVTKSLAEAHRREEELLARVPDEAGEAEFLGQVSRLAKDVGMGLSDYHPGPVQPRGDCSTMEVALTCQGNYDSLCRFLDGLGRLPRLVHLGRLEIHAPEGDARRTALAKLVIYFGVKLRDASVARSGELRSGA